jgi:hypothetical protein
MDADVDNSGATGGQSAPERILGGKVVRANAVKLNGHLFDTQIDA